MTTSIIPQLVRKDFLLWRRLILVFCIASAAFIGILFFLHGRIPDNVLISVGFTLLIAPAGTCGIVLLILTNVFEKAKSTQSFIMSLPVTVREFTITKLLVNIPVFTAMWVVVTAVAFYFSFGRGLFPAGTLPYLTMVFLGVYVAYVCILSVSLLSQSLGMTIIAIFLCETGTSAYLWVIAFLDPIRNHVYGPEAVWNSMAVAIVLTQILVTVCALAGTLYFQSRKRDFI